MHGESFKRFSSANRSDGARFFARGFQLAA
jgi:hypothetical protein